VSTVLQFSYIHPHSESQNDAFTAFEVNGVSFDPPTVPVLLQILSGAKNASDLLPAGSIYGLERNKSVELTIPGGAIGGPVSVRGSWLNNNAELMIIASFDSILFICMVTTSMWSAALVTRRTTLTTLFFVMS
jgi:hypothetical protein